MILGISPSRQPRQQHDLTVEAVGIDAGMHLTRRRERQTVNDDRVYGGSEQELFKIMR
jgi:hypothetical protein